MYVVLRLLNSGEGGLKAELCLCVSIVKICDNFLYDPFQKGV